MKRFLTGASRTVGPRSLGSVWKWLIAGGLTFGIAPVSVQAQNMMGPARFGRPPVSGNMSFSMGGFQPGTSLNMGGPTFLPLTSGFGSRAPTSMNPYAMNPYAMASSMSPYMMSSSMSGSSYMN